MSKTESMIIDHDEPGVSIIVPVYNTKQYLSRCIDSIMSQRFTDFELLLIDDGSTDGSGDICDAYAEKDNRVRVFHKENGGASSARNVGLENAIGDWVTFVDSDDYVLDDYLSLCSEKNENLCTQNWRYANGEVNEWFEPQIVDNEDCQSFLKENLHTDMFRTACCSFFKRKILIENGIRFDTRFKLGEDTLFVMDYYRYVDSIRIMGNSCYIYNRQDNWNNKYCLSFGEAISYLSTFMDKYDALPFKSMSVLPFMFNFIKKMTKIDNLCDELKWVVTKPVLRYKKKQLPYKGVKYRMKYYLEKLVSAFINE